MLRIEHRTSHMLSGHSCKSWAQLTEYRCCDVEPVIYFSPCSDFNTATLWMVGIELKLCIPAQ